jgi:phosphatidylserine synthase 2
MGQHVWLLLATILTELLAITKWAKGQFTAPLPKTVRLAWSVGGMLLVLYPTVRVCILSSTSYSSHKDSSCVTVWDTEHPEVPPQAVTEE